jgi:hypothetical protein
MILGSAGSAGSFLPRSISHFAISGTTVTATRSDASSASETVKAKGRKIRPTMPVTRPSGTNTATVVSVDEEIADETSLAASRTLSGVRSSPRRRCR